MPMLNTGGNSKTELTEVKSQLEQINSEKYDKVTLYENVLKFYANEVELTSITLPGFEGNGQNAREIELQKSETHIQWRYVGEEVWRDLVALNDIKGDAGDKGDKGDRGLPVSININEINYTHQDGIITLPNYPNKTSDLENDAGFITSADIDTTQNHVHANKTSLDKITEQKMTSWDNKSNFSGSYNDLTNIPSSFKPATHRHDASEIDNLPTGGSIDFGANNNWTGINTFTNLVKIIRNNEVQRMEQATANNACYYTFYKNKQSRSGYFGYGSAYNNTFVIGNDVNDADVNVETKGAGRLKSNGKEVALQETLTNAIGIHKIWSGTQEEYDTITNKDANTIYFIKKV